MVRGLLRPREDCAPPGHDGTVPSAPGEERSARTRAGRGSEDDEPDASGADDGGDSSDHDFEMVDLNEKLTPSQLLVTPCRPGTCDEAEKPARVYSSHRWMHLILGSRRQPRGSRDLEQLEAEVKDGRGSPPAAEELLQRRAREPLPPWRRKRFLGLPERDSPSHSSPDRGSDCSHNSSDHEDGSFAGRRTPLDRSAADGVPRVDFKPEGVRSGPTGPGELCHPSPTCCVTEHSPTLGKRGELL